MRLGEVLALKWGDIQFGEEEDGGNRFIYVRRNWVDGQFGKPKSGKERRVDLSKQLRRVVAKLHDDRMLEAYLAGKSSVAGDPSSLPRPEPRSMVAMYTRGTSFLRTRKQDSDTSESTIFVTPMLPCSFRPAPALLMSGINLVTALFRSQWISMGILSRVQMSVGSTVWTARNQRNNPQLPRNKEPLKKTLTALK
jgi:integrase